MAKGLTQKKATKKKPAKTMKETSKPRRSNTVCASVVPIEAPPTAPIDVCLQ